MRHHIADPVVHREHWREPEDDQLRLECGVCGVWGAEEDEGSAIVALGLSFWYYWLMAIGGAFLIIAVGGLLFEYYVGQNATQS